MSVQELKQAVAQLSRPELLAFAEWFADYQQEMWDRQIAEDSEAGRLDGLIDQARRDFQAGRAKALGTRERL